MSTPSTIDVLKGTLFGYEVPLNNAAHLAEQEAKLLQEAAIRKAEIASLLRAGTWVVEFTKVDGTPAIMECTLDPRLLPQSETQTGRTTVENATVLRVYATDREGWRSFKVLNTTRIYPKPDSL